MNKPDGWRSLHRYASEALVSATSEDLARSTIREYLQTAKDFGERAYKAANKSEQHVSAMLLAAVELVRLENDL